MEKTLEIQTNQQWKALSHPLRVRVLELLARGAMTNEQLANMLGVESGKLYFHTKRLLDAGLIEIAETRQKGPITEKLYRPAAQRLTLPPLTKGGNSPPLDPLLSHAFELYRNTWRETDGLKDELELGFHLILPQEPEQMQEFAIRLKALCDEFQATASHTSKARSVSLAVLMHSLPLLAQKKEKTS